MLHITQEGYDKSFSFQSLIEMCTPIFKLWKTGLTQPVFVPDMPSNSFTYGWNLVYTGETQEDNLKPFKVNIDKRLVHLITKVKPTKSIQYDAISLHYEDGSLFGFCILGELRTATPEYMNEHHIWYYLTTGNPSTLNATIVFYKRPYAYIEEVNSFDDLPALANADRRIYRATLFNTTLLVHAGKSLADPKDYQQNIWVLSECSIVGGNKLNNVYYANNGNDVFIAIPAIYEYIIPHFISLNIELALSCLDSRVYKVGVYSLVSVNNTNADITVPIADNSVTLKPDMCLVRLSNKSRNKITGAKGVLYMPNTDAIIVSLMKAASEMLHNHLISLTDHNMVKESDFIEFVKAIIPVGYEHKQWGGNTATISSAYDAILNLGTYWRKLRGVISVAIDPSDNFINVNNRTLGHKRDIGVLANRPDWYPLYTKDVFERTAFYESDPSFFDVQPDDAKVTLKWVSSLNDLTETTSINEGNKLYLIAVAYGVTTPLHIDSCSFDSLNNFLPYTDMYGNPRYLTGSLLKTQIDEGVNIIFYMDTDKTMVANTHTLTANLIYTNERGGAVSKSVGVKVNKRIQVIDVIGSMTLTKSVSLSPPFYYGDSIAATMDISTFNNPNIIEVGGSSTTTAAMMHGPNGTIYDGESNLRKQPYGVSMYARWMSRLPSDPSVISNYAKDNNPDDNGYFVPRKRGMNVHELNTNGYYMYWDCLAYFDVICPEGTDSVTVTGLPKSHTVERITSNNPSVPVFRVTLEKPTKWYDINTITVSYLGTRYV